MIFENFLKFLKRRRAVPMGPIWNIMVAAKLDQSRVLVTKFRQNRLTLKGRSAGQRQTHRQINSAENNLGPFRFAIGPTDTSQQHLLRYAFVRRAVKKYRTSTHQEMR